MSAPVSSLRKLLAAISESIERIEDAYAGAGVEFPSLDAPFDPTQLSSTLLFRPDIVHEATVILGATEQLATAVRSPQTFVLETAFGVSRVPFIVREFVLIDCLW